MYRLSVAVLLSLIALAASAAAPHSRSFDAVPGFNATETRAMAQDSRGFMWFAGATGLIRFDGQQARRFAANDRPCGAQSVSVDLLGVYALDDCGQLFSVDSQYRTQQLLTGASGRVRAAASSGAHRYAVVDHQLVAVFGDTSRALGITVVPEPFGFPRLLPLPCGVVLSTSLRAWLVHNDHPDDPPEPLRHINGAEIGDVVAAAGCEGRALTLLTRFPGVLYRASVDAPASMSKVHAERNRGIGLAYRGQRLWVSYDIRLLAFNGDSLTRSYPQSRDLPSGGPLLVDAEQSLWIGSMARVLQLPDPDTQRFDASAGLVSSHAYDVVAEPWRGEDAVLAISWQGAHRLRKGRVENPQPLDVFGTACTSAKHSWYASQRDWQLDRASGTVRAPRLRGDDTVITQCLAVAGGDLAASGLGLIMRREGEAQPTVLRRALHPDDPPGISALALHDDRLWLAAGNEVCDVNPQAPDSDAATCRRCDGARNVRALLPYQGRLYASASPLGVVRIDRDGCHPQRLEDPALAIAIQGLSPAHDGGFWAYGTQSVLRLLPGGSEQLQVVERVGQSHGLGSTAAVALLDTGPALWVANIEGFTQIRRDQPGAALPSLQLAPLRASADGMTLNDGQVLPSSTRVIDLNFAGLSFKEPGQLRYRHRINTAAWSAPSASSRLTLTGIQAGAYTLEVAFQATPVSPWSPSERLRFVVSSPWYRTGRGMGLMALTMLALWATVMLLRRQRQQVLERQRQDIAADLHDELGSELASVRVLSSLLDRDDLSDRDRRTLIADLQDSSEAATGNLRRLVAHMKSGTTLGQLLAQIRRLGERLCGSALQVEFNVSDGDKARVLSALRYRQTHLLLSEVLSNAARHAHATSVILHARLQTGVLVIECSDNGRGFDPQDTQGNGLGHLRERARKLGARLHIAAATGAGVEVRLELPL